MAQHKGAMVVTATIAVTLVLAGCAVADDGSGYDAQELSGSNTVTFEGDHVSATQFQEAIDQPHVIVVDVRTPEEFAEGHLPGAINIDVSATDFAERISALEPADTYAVYCRTANRSQVALDVMDSQGFTSVVGMSGGIVAWPGTIVQPQNP